MRVYEDMHNYLKARNCKPKLNIMYNKAYTSLKSYITNANVNYQLVEPNNHRVNVAERAIRTFSFFGGRTIACATKISYVSMG